MKRVVHLCGHSLGVILDVISNKMSQPPSQASEEYKYEKKRDRQNVKERKKAKKEVKKAFDKIPSIKPKQRLHNIQRQFTVKNRRQEKNNPTKDAITSYGPYGAHHQVNSNKADPIAEKFASRVEKPKKRNPIKRWLYNNILNTEPIEGLKYSKK